MNLQHKKRQDARPVSHTQTYDDAIRILRDAGQKQDRYGMAMDCAASLLQHMKNGRTEQWHN